MDYLKMVIEESAHPEKRERRSSLSMDVYQKIKGMLFRQQLIPGQKIIYEDLAQILNVSTTPIINALSKLEQEGIVTSQFQRGYYVSEISEKEANELLDTREILEEYCIKKVIDNLDTEKTGYIEGRYKELKDYTPKSYDKKRLYLDGLFHVSIAEMAGNSLVTEIMAGIFEKIYLRYRTERIPITRMEEADKEHGALVEAIKKKDKKKTLTVLQKHYVAVRSNIIRTIS